MYEALIITPVKNSIETTLKTIESIKNSNGNFLYYIYNDFSSEDITLQLNEICSKNHIQLINLKEYTHNASPNYRLVLQMAQKIALENNLPLIIVESDVVVQKETLKHLTEQANKLEKVGLLGHITRNEAGLINYPYTNFKEQNESIIQTKHSLSFCCTLFSTSLLSKYNFAELSLNKHWFDTSISKKSLILGFTNYLITTDGVIHYPHSSRPWKMVKYRNPLKYYLIKLFKRLDRI